MLHHKKAGHFHRCRIDVRLQTKIKSHKNKAMPPVFKEVNSEILLMKYNDGPAIGLHSYNVLNISAMSDNKHLSSSCDF